MKIKIRKISLISWLLSIGVFAGILIWLSVTGKTFDQDHNILFIAFCVDILFGIVAFLSFLITSANSGNKIVKDLIKEEKIIQKEIAKQQTNPWLIMTVILSIVVAFLIGSKNTAFLGTTQINTPTVSNTLVPTVIPVATSVPIKPVQTESKSNTGSQIECIGPDGKHFQTTMDNCKNLNEKWGKPVDYMVDCNITPDCGGGTIWMSLNQCKKPCSGLPQKTNNVSSQKNSQPSSGNSYQCWNNAYGYFYYTSSGDQCNRDNSTSSLSKSCYDLQKAKVNSCSSVCSGQLEQDKTACAYAFTGPNAGIEQSSEKYGECLSGSEGAGEEYSTCLGKCSAQYEQDLKQCN